MGKQGLSDITYLDRLFLYLNPIERLGVRSYSTILPSLSLLVIFIASELFLYRIISDPTTISTYILFITITLIVYFSFRDGIAGGMTATIMTLLYYLYIIVNRDYQGDQLKASLEATVIFGFAYFVLAFIIGWLKQQIDLLIEKQKIARVEAEEGRLQLETILQQLPVGVLMLDQKGNIQANAQADRLMARKIPRTIQLTPASDSAQVYRTDKQLLPKNWPIVRALQKGEVVKSEELEIVRIDKKRIFVQVNAAPIRNADKQIVAAVSTIHDVTQEKLLEKRKDDFVSMASHELKTPLTSMKLCLTLLQDWLSSSADQNVKKTLNSVVNQTNKLQELVNDLLDVTRIQTGKLQLQKQQFELHELIQECIELLVATTRKKQKIEFAQKGKVLVIADRFRIYQVLTNLISNAIKYSPENTTITITTNIVAGMVTVSVADQGIGIAKDDQKRVFEKLFQATTRQARGSAGLGMGLYISQQIIQRHRGKIWVSSEIGHGSIFSFTLKTA